MENPTPANPPHTHGWRRFASGWRAGLIVLICIISGAAFAFGWWRAGGAGILALALAMLPCGIACALGLCVLDRRKTKNHCHTGGAPNSR
jgi:hypothetical protein